MYKFDINHNKMFNHLDQRDERSIRMEKSRIYKEMLDNQILLNQQLRRKQEAKRISQEKYFSKVKMNDKRQSLDRSYQKQKQYKKSKKALRLPTLEDKQTFYHGHSNYIKTPNSKSRRKVLSRIQTEEISKYDEQGSSSQSEKLQDIEQILIELKSLNRQVKKVKSSIKKKHLIGSSRKPKKQRIPKVEINYNENAEESPSSRFPKRYKSPSNLQQYERDAKYRSIQQNQYEGGKKMGSLLYHSPKNQQRTNDKSLNQQSKLNESSDLNTNDNSEIQKQRRQRFLQILRKVKNRGESLFIKLSKFPKN